MGSDAARENLIAVVAAVALNRSKCNYNDIWYMIWLVVSTPLKNMKVSGGYYSQYMEKIKNVLNHQPVIYLGYRSCNNIHNCGHNCTDFVKYQSPKTVADTPSFMDDIYNLFPMCHQWNLIFGAYPPVNEHSYWKWPCFVDLPIKKCDFPYLCSFTRG